MAQKTRFLETLRAELAAIEKAAAPVRVHLGLVAPIALPAEAEDLPLPLFVLFSQLSAAQVCTAPTAEICRYLSSDRSNNGIT